MKQVLQQLRSGKLEVAEVPAPGAQAGRVVVRNTASLISAGTERMLIEFAGRTLLGKARERPDLVRQVFDKVRKDGIIPAVQTVLNRLDQPLPLGYSCAGTVMAVGQGAEEFSPGSRVACAGMGYASHAEVVSVPRNLVVPIPDGVSDEDAAYVTLGAIALQGVRVAEVQLGETVAIIGLGLLGQLAVQILKAAGCVVLGIDLDPAKVRRALELGADRAVVRTGDVNGVVAALTAGVGVDAVLIAAAADSNDPTELAGAIARDRARVSVIGQVRLDVPRKLYYEKELQLRLSRAYGPGRYDPAYEEQGHDYPIGYVRWTERRNMAEFLRLVAAGQVTPARLTTHRFPIAEAERAYQLITGDGGEAFTGVVLTYHGREAPARTVTWSRPAPVQGAVGVGFIGAGNFARAVLLPAFKRAGGVDLIGVVSAIGLNAQAAGTRFGFRYASTEVQQLLDDPAVHAVVIATRHGSHARLAADALGAGKAVFVEKPLAIDAAGLEEVLAAHREHGHPLTVGFNRRFSAPAATLKAAFLPGQPLTLDYRINAGAVSGSSWVNNPADGGGRIIGEVCHFIDLLQFLTDEPPVEAFAYRLGGAAGAAGDSVVIALRFERGSVASLTYAAGGDKSFSKERLEVFGGGVVGVLEDFRSLVISHDGKRRRIGRFTQDKGFDAEVRAFLQGMRGGPPPIEVPVLAATTRATFAIVESLGTGRPVPIPRD